MADIDGDGAGGLVATEPEVRTVVQVTADGDREVLADGLDGVAFSSPNGVAAASDGTVWFTDFAPGAPTPLGYRGVFRVSPEGVVAAEVEMDPEATAPNGIALSPDEQTLYVSDTLGNDITAYAIGPDGGLEDAAAPEWVAEFDGFPDGVCVDATGNIYAIGGGAGVAAYAPDGTLWGTIALPDPELQPTNCAVGGDDGRTLFVTTATTLYRIALG
jgi:gluconolactonase